MSAIIAALRAANQRLLVIIAVLLMFGIAWAVWANAGGPGGGFGTTSTDASFPATPGFAIAPEPAPSGVGRAEAGSAGVAPADSGLKALPPSDGGSGGVALQSVLGRTVIRSGQMELVVESVTDTFERIRLLAESSGGFVADSSIYGRGEHQSASMVLRVPAARFGQVIEDLRKLGVDVNSLSTSSQDVTEEYSDLQATVRNLTAVESQYLELLGRAEGIGEVLMVQDRLNQVRLQIEQIQGRINLLDHLTTLASITVFLTLESTVPVEQPSSGLLDAAREAWEASLATLESIARAVVVVAVYSWWLIPLLVLALVAGRRALRARARVDTPEGRA